MPPSVVRITPVPTPEQTQILDADGQLTDGSTQGRLILDDGVMASSTTVWPHTSSGGDESTPTVPFQRGHSLFEEQEAGFHWAKLMAIALLPPIVLLIWALLPTSGLYFAQYSFTTVLFGAVFAAGTLVSTLPLLLNIHPPYPWLWAIPGALIQAVLALGLLEGFGYRPALPACAFVGSMLLLLPPFYFFCRSNHQASAHDDNEESMYFEMLAAKWFAVDFSLTGFVRITLGLLIVVAQLCFSMVFGTIVFPNRAVWVQVLLCCVYPVAVQMFKVLAARVVETQGQAAILAYFSQAAAAFPYRFLFPGFGTWSVLFAILGVELGFKLGVYFFKAFRQFWVVRNHIVSAVQRLGVTGKMLVHVDPDDPGEALRGIAEKFAFHQLVDFSGCVTLMLVFAILRALGRKSLGFIVVFDQQQFTTLMVHYTIGAVFEVAFFGVMFQVVKLTGQEKTFRLRPALARLCLAHWPVTACVCAAYVATLQYVSAYTWR
eukprot:NODE_619_length_1755_cov_61.170762_g609_i0.p1 GENE.NODE_619_length_1755_cov_61.170762_g609_i0~~NODE_619_length_1755_cov_61.170762_g609_i0.p1  ORF type:complete len:489 (+),score=58.85 NODE_619_length_1755_cov_61.170762_g609_i0:116-1582(+)